VGVGARCEPAQSKIVSGTYFNVLGIRPILGRAFNNQDDGLQSPFIQPMAFGKRSFGGSDSVLGRQLTLEGMPLHHCRGGAARVFGEAVGEAPDVWVRSAWNERSGATLPAMYGSTCGPPQAWRQGVSCRRAGPDRPQSDRGFVQRLPWIRVARSLGLRDRFSDPLRILMAVVGSYCCISRLPPDWQSLVSLAAQICAAKGDRQLWRSRIRRTAQTHHCHQNAQRIGEPRSRNPKTAATRIHAMRCTNSRSLCGTIGPLGGS